MAEGEAPPEGDQGGEDEGLVETIRSVVSETLGDLFGTGKADVEDKAEGAPKPAGDPEARTWTPREIQEFAAAEMRRVQDELKAKRKATAPRRQEQPGAGDTAPGTAAGGGASDAASPPATETKPTSPKSWRNRLWGTA